VLLFLVLVGSSSMTATSWIGSVHVTCSLLWFSLCVLFHWRRNKFPISGRYPAAVLVSNIVLISLLVIQSVEQLSEHAPCFIHNLTFTVLIPLCQYVMLMRVYALLAQFVITKHVTDVARGRLLTSRLHNEPFFVRRRSWARSSFQFRASLALFALFLIISTIITGMSFP
jgi:hypothetical protein